jgi:hypothetical protein
MEGAGRSLLGTLPPLVGGWGAGSNGGASEGEVSRSICMKWRVNPGAQLALDKGVLAPVPLRRQLHPTGGGITTE